MSEEFGHALLAAIEAKRSENSKRYFETLKPLESVVRRALGLKDPEEEDHRFAVAAASVVQLKVKSEFPHLHAKYESSGIEVGDRRVCNNLTEHGQILRAHPGYGYVLPMDAPLPPKRAEKE